MLEPKCSTLKAPPCGCRVYRTATTAAAMSQRRRERTPYTPNPETQPQTLNPCTPNPKLSYPKP